MKFPPYLTVICLSLVPFALSARADRSSETKMDMITVTERGDSNSDTSPWPQPYVAVDCGLVEAGEAMAGEKPPAPADVAAALAAVVPQDLAASANPSLVLIYNWGVIRPDTSQVSPTADVSPNFRARLGLVTSPALVKRITERLVIERYTPLHPYLEHPAERDAIDQARGSRYFVIVSAYDAADLSRGQKTLRWRTRLSTDSNSGTMDEVIVSLIHHGAKYFGRYEHEAISDQVSVGAVASQPATRLSMVTPANLDRENLRNVVIEERAMATGENLAQLRKQWERKGDPHRQARPSSGTERSHLDFPPALAQRISSYLQAKTELQRALTKQLGAQPSNADPRLTVDSFDREHGAAIAALVSEREQIRGQLAQFVGNEKVPLGDKSLDVLLREFAAGTREVDAKSTAGRE